MNEIFKPVPNTNDKYLISNHGRVYSNASKKFLKPFNTPGGYLRFNTGRGEFKWLAHRLVATVFIPNPNNLPKVNHIDFDPTNNIVTNLEWVTAKQNKQHSVQHERPGNRMEAAIPASITNRQKQQELKYQQLLGDYFIKTYRKNKSRRITYKCKRCGSIEDKQAVAKYIPLKICKKCYHAPYNTNLSN